MYNQYTSHLFVLCFVAFLDIATSCGSVYSRIEAQASISFLALETRLQNEIGVYLCNTVLAPGRMSARSAAQGLYLASFCHFSL
jgi:hypothetical protein